MATKRTAAIQPLPNAMIIADAKRATVTQPWRLYFQSITDVVSALSFDANGNPINAATLPIAQSDVVNLVADLSLKAPLDSPHLTGIPTAPTATVGTSTTQLATTAFVAAAIGSSGGGDVVGPASATDGAVAVYNGTTGKLLKNSTWIIGSPLRPDTDNVYDLGTVTQRVRHGYFAGTVTAGSLGPTPLNATNITSGTLDDARLSANVQLKPLAVADLPPHHAAHEPGGSDALLITGPSRLFGRGDGGAGALQEISLGANLQMTGTTLAALTRSSPIFRYNFSAANIAPPGANQVRFDSGFPYGATTKVWIWDVTTDGEDVFHGLKNMVVGSRLNIQDANDHTQYVYFTITATPIDNTTYFEVPVTHVEHGTSLSGGQPVLVQNTFTAGEFGDVDGPSSATDNAIAIFDGTTGKLLKDSLTLIASVATKPIPQSDVTNLVTDLAAKVAGPASSLNNSIAIYSGTTGKLIKDSAIQFANVAIKNLANTFTAANDFTGGSITAATATAGTSTTQVATTAFVTNAVSTAGNVTGPASATDSAIVLFNGTTGKIIKDSVTLLTSLAPLASPALTGTPTVPTAAPGTNTTQVASTAFVQAAVSASPSGDVVGPASSTVDSIAVFNGTTGKLLKNVGLPYIYNNLPLLNVANVFVATNDFTGAPSIRLVSTAPEIQISATAQPVGQKNWRILTNSGALQWRAADDGFIASSTPTISLDRAGNLLTAGTTHQFGGTTNSFPMLKQSSAPAQLSVRLADDSADAVLTAATAAPGTNTTQVATTAFVLANAAPIPVSLTTQVTGTLQAAQEPAHTGDVTNTAGSLVLAIGALKVTNAMLAGSITASKLVGTDLVIAESQVTNLVSDLALKAPLASPALTGVPTAPTAGVGTSTTQIATTAYVVSAITASGGGNVVGPASATDTAIARFSGTTGKIIQDSGVTIDTTGNVTIPAAATVTVAGRSKLASTADGNFLLTNNAGTDFTALRFGAASIAAPMIKQVFGTNPDLSLGRSLQVRTDDDSSQAWLRAILTADDIFFGTLAEPRVSSAIARLASPALTGTPTAPTATAGTNTTQIATTAFVASAITANPTGYVVGPASATAGDIALFNSSTGKVIKDSLVAIDSSGNMFPLTNAQDLSGVNLWKNLQLSGVLTVGSSPAVGVGAIRLANNAFIYTRDMNNVTNIFTIGVANDNRVYVGEPSVDSGLVLRSGVAVTISHAASQTVFLTGGRLTFPAAQNASTDVNTLDDYEEGAWTPTIGGSGGQSGQAYSNFSAHYIKIAKWVYVSFEVYLSAKGTITGNVYLRGLPFTVDSGMITGYLSGYVAFSALATNWIHLQLQALPGTTDCQFFGLSAASTSNFTSLASTDLTNTSLFRGTVVYRASA
jgi:hypothetical protein